MEKTNGFQMGALQPFEYAGKNPLVETLQNEKGDILISGRELHEFLESKERYSKWFNRMLEYGFVENVDFTSGQKSTLVNNGASRKLEDHLLKMDMAKEVAMIQRNEKGKQARQYFLKLEKLWNSPEMVMKRALDFANYKIGALTTENLVLNQQVNELQPKASYYDMVLQNKSLLSITMIAKDYGMSGQKLNGLLHEWGVQYKRGGIWLLYAKYQDKGYTHADTHVMDAETTKLHTKWTQNGRLFLYDLLKSKGILPMIERNGAPTYQLELIAGGGAAR